METALDKLESRVELVFLYDFYGALLKENQQQIFEAYMLEDYSLGEIANDMGITRQGVHDVIKRCSKQLLAYEEKLGLAKKFQTQKDTIEAVHKRLNQMDDKNSPDMKAVINLLEEILE